MTYFVRLHCGEHSFYAKSLNIVFVFTSYNISAISFCLRECVKLYTGCIDREEVIYESPADLNQCASMQYSAGMVKRVTQMVTTVVATKGYTSQKADGDSPSRFRQKTVDKYYSQNQS
jgi:hypothetical protein